MLDKTLVTVSLYYKNDLANGFGMSIHPDVYESVSNEAASVWNDMRHDFCNDDSLAAYLIDQLKSLGECKRADFSTAQQLLVVMNILLLTEHGYIANDEFNGVMYAYVDGAGAVEVIDAIYS